MNVISHHITTEEEFSDFYCGAGGSSSGLKKAGLRGRIAANHWKLAVETHQHNHPEIAHREVDLLVASPAAFPYSVIAWFSPECTWHARRTRGEKTATSQLDMFSKVNPNPAEERSRVTMWDVVRFSEYHRYQVVIVENVLDIKYWPPYQSWLQAMESLGYDYKICYFNSRFFHPLNGQDNFAPQNRDRFYAVFWRKGNKPPNLDFRPMAYCLGCQQDVRAIQVFKQPVFPLGEYDTTGKRGQYYYGCPNCFTKKDGEPVARRVEPYYFAAYNIIDWSLPCPLIGERSKALKPKTLNRIRIGLDKFGRQPLVIQLAYNHATNNRAEPISGVLPTLTKWQTLSLCTPFVVNTSYEGDARDVPVTSPIPSQTTRQSLAFIMPFKGEAEYQHLRPSAEALPVQTTSGAPALVVASYLIEMYGGGDMRLATDPLNTVTAGGRKTGLLTISPYIVSYYRRDNTASGICDPIPTIPGENRFALIAPQTPFLTSYYNGSNGVHGVDDPVYTLTTDDRHSLVMPEIDLDSCGFRMLEPEECKLGQGFDRDYVILGSAKKDQVKQIGNAVSDPVAQFLGQAARDSLN